MQIHLKEIFATMFDEAEGWGSFLRDGERLSHLLPCRWVERGRRRHHRRGEEGCLTLGGLKLEVGNRRLRMKGAPSGSFTGEG